VAKHRRSPGNLTAVPRSFSSNPNAPTTLIGYFLLNTARLMNLSDKLYELTELSTTANASSEDVSTYNDLLITPVELIVKRDVNNDYLKPAIAALLRLCNPLSVSGTFVSGNAPLPCTLNVA